MAIKREFVRKHIGEFTIPVMTVELGEDMEVGLLFTIDEHGKAMKADNKAWQTKQKPAVGVIPYSSLEGWGEKFEFNRPEVLKKGEVIDVYQFGILYAEELVTELKADDSGNHPENWIGKPVYLGENGKVTATAPSESNKGVQIIGHIANPKTGAVRVTILDRGEKKA